MWWIFAIGFLAQGFFSARILIQWILSERSRKVESPSAFWICSIIGSWLLFVYGCLRGDFSIILGQLVAYYIYLWNLNAKGLWQKMYAVVRWALLLTPVVALTILYRGIDFSMLFFRNEDIPMWLLLFGSLGQLIFSLRFVYQWYYSSRHGESVLPKGFWLMSLVGSGIIILYGVIRLDPVLILGQSVGFVAYVRNLIIGSKARKTE